MMTAAYATSLATAGVAGVEQTPPELITDKAVSGDGGNHWGPHKTRIVRTQDGVFTVYAVAGAQAFRSLFHTAVKPTEEYPWAQCHAYSDNYLDAEGRMHILYLLNGEATEGAFVLHHAVVAASGKLLHDVALPKEAGLNCRLVQDSAGCFYLLGSEGLLYPAGHDGVTLADPTSLDLGGHRVGWYAVSVPRAGSAPCDTMDVVFNANGGRTWVYCQLRFWGKRLRAGKTAGP